MLEKNQVATALVVFIVYIILYINYDFDMPRNRNFMINLPLFVFGMLLAINREKISTLKKQYKLAIILACIAAIIVNLLGNKINLPNNLLFIGVVAYMALYLIFENIRPIGIIKAISCSSYSIYLTHHIINTFLSVHFEGVVLNKVELLLVFCIYIILIILFSSLLMKINNYILNNFSRLFLKGVNNK